MILNVTIFTFVLLLSLLLSSGKRLNFYTKRRIFLRITFIVLFFIVAFRGYDIGNDTEMYLNLFERASLLKWDIVKPDEYFEIGYLILNVIISYITSSKRFFMIVMSAIFNFCAYKFIKENSKNYLVSVIMYIGLLFFYTSMTMMRQFTAMLILLYSLKFAKEKKMVPFIVCLLIAVQFHTSAWIGALYYIIVNLKFSKKNVAVIIIISIIASIMIGPLSNFVADIVGRTNYYENRLGSDSISNVLYTLIYLIFFIFSYIVVKNKNKEENNIWLYSILFAMASNALGINMNILSRVSLYFNILTINALPNIIHTNIKDTNTKIFINMLLIIFFFIYSSTIIILKPEWNSAYNYRIGIC